MDDEFNVFAEPSDGERPEVIAAMLEVLARKLAAANKELRWTLRIAVQHYPPAAGTVLLMTAKVLPRA